MIRISNAALICAIVLTIAITLIINKQWKCLLYNAVAFLIGMCIAFLPMVIYFGVNGLLGEMFYQVFGYGFLYTNIGKNSGWFYLFNGNYRKVLYPFYIVLLTSLLLFRKTNWRTILLIWTSTAATMAAIALSGRNFEHYYALLIPIAALDVWFLYWMISRNNNIDRNGINGVIRTEGSRTIQRRNTSIVYICALVFAVSYYGTYKLDQEYIAKNVNVDHSHASDEAIIDLASHISDNESVYAWTAQPRWYMYADKFPCFRYCGWQADQMAIDPSIGNALEEMFMNNPPIWLVIENNANEHPYFVDESIEEYFTETYRNDYWILYHREREL